MATGLLSSCSNESAVSEPSVIILGTLEENYDLNKMVSQFNDAHPEYHIEVKLYGSGMFGDTDGLDDLRMEIVSGAGPDIINFGSCYSGSFAAGGITVDLIPYLENEGMLDEEEYFSNLFCATKVGEELSAISPSFSLISFVGKESLLSGRQNWDIEEMTDCYSSMPEGTMLFPGDNKISVFAFLCMKTMDSFVDWSAGTCEFTDERFVNTIAFTDYFSEGLMLDENFSYHASYVQDKALLFPITVDNVYVTGLADALLGEKSVFIGYPIDREAGKQSGNLIKPGEIVLGIGANSKYKEEAWEYIYQFFQEEYQESLEDELPVKRSVLEENLLKAQVAEMTVDEAGNSVKVMQAKIGLEGEEPIQISVITKEQAEYFFDIIQNADSSATVDKEMYSIALEEVQMYISKDRSAKETAEVIQSRLSMYVGEKQ